MQILVTLTNLFQEALVQLQGLTGSLGLSILLFTFLMRSLLVPLSIPGLKSQKKIRELLALREPFYKQADVLVNTGLRSPREVAQQIELQYRLARRGSK